MKTTKAQRHQVKVLVDVTAMAGARPTGIGNYTRFLLEELAQLEGIEVATSWRPGGSRRWANLKPLLPDGLPARRWLPILSGLNLRRFDLYHGTDGRIPEGGRLRKVVTVHDMAVYEPRLLDERFAAQGRERFEAMLHNCRPDRILTISEFTRERLIEKFPETEAIARVVPLGVRAARHHGLPAGSGKQARGVSDENNMPQSPGSTTLPFILSAGTIERRKNQVTTVKAFEIVKQKFPELQLVIAGGEGFDSGAALQAIEQSPVKDSIIRLGYVSDEEMARLYGSAVASVYPSLYEGFGLPILEAMGAGCPVVTSDRGAMLETAGDAALVADPDDVDSIAGQIIRLLEDSSLRASFVVAGLGRAAYFSWKRCAEGTAGVYAEVAG